MALVNCWKNFDSFPSILLEFWCSNISTVTEHTRNQIVLASFQKKIFFRMFTLVLLDGFLDGFSKFRSIIVQICILIWYFWVIFENYSMRMLSIRGNDCIAHWAYEETLSLSRTNFRACSASGKILTVFTWTSMLSIRGNDFITPWAYAEMFKSQISWPNRIQFSKILCYRPLGP